MRILIHTLTVFAFLTLTQHAQAQAYPAKPIRIIVPLAPDGPSDFLVHLHLEMVRTVQSPEFRPRLEAEGAEIIATTPEQAAAAIRADLEK